MTVPVCSKKFRASKFLEQTALSTLIASMKMNPALRTSAFLLKIFAVAALSGLATVARGSTFWNGSSISFTQNVDGASDVLATGAVALSRGINGPLFNSVTEGGVGTVSPADTTWAVGSPSMIGNLSAATIPTPSSFLPLTTLRAQHANFDFQAYLLNGNGSGGPITFVVHLVNEDIYLTLTFTSWGRFFSGGFSYNRSTPSGVTPPPPPAPTVSITSPASGAVFAAPANVKFTVNASVSSGSVTNVAFFNGASSLGSSQTSPFNFTSGSLGAGSYSLTAVATAAGISATSSVVNVSVVTPVATSLSAPTAGANNQFSFSYSANAGLNYVVESSSNLFNWTPLFTNTANSSSVSFSTDILPGDAFYRVGRVPNP